MITFWWGRTDSPGCGRTTAVASVHWTLAKSRLSNPLSKYPNAQKDQSERIGLFVVGLTEMNRRRNIEGYFKTESSKYKLNKWVPGTLVVQNKG